MNVDQKLRRDGQGWTATVDGGAGDAAQLLLLFAARTKLEDGALFQELRASYPQAIIVGCSTSGEICGTEVNDDSAVATAIRFEHTAVRSTMAEVEAAAGSYAAGAAMAKKLSDAELTHVMLFSDGLKVNGTEIARGLRENLPEAVAVTGGLAGDGDRFQHTFVCANDAPAEGRVVAVGFYGRRLHIGYGSLGGWNVFGPARLVTRSKGNVLYELDNESALDLYKMYLGDHAADLPASALLFPLEVREEQGTYSLVRTVLGTDEEEKSMTFAGDIPEGAYARLMKANFDRLIDGAAGAAEAGLTGLQGGSPSLAILISCVGRKLLLKQRTEEEVESVRDVLGPQTVLTGFYSYGEICPHGTITKCELHNQTMTITTFSEM